MFYCGHVRLGFAQGPLHSSRHFLGRAVGGGGWVGLSTSQLAFMARSSRFCSLRHPPKLAGGRGEKRPPATWRARISIGLWRTFPATSRPTSCMTGHSVSCSSVDNRTFKRLLYQVLDHDPGHKDIEAFLRRFEKALRQRGLVLQGVTTDGSPLYPEPLQAVFGDVPHPICEFHILKELTKVILRAVAKVRKKLAERKSKVKRGRPSTPTAKRAVRQRQRLQQKIADPFEHRYLFVQHELTLTQRRTLHRITRGLPQPRALRAIMGEVYRLFDRRCRTDTALAKLAKLRQRVRRFKQVGKILSKLQSPNLDKALTFLDDKLLPSTSNAVERSNRRHRKMQKTVYRVRTQENINNRVVL